VASIGPITSETLREYGIEPAIEAKEFTIEGLVDAIIGGSGRAFATD
jgi:uroporphyrinogen III methyltransferase/synthase